jgi:hypothetical protein
MNQIKQQTKQSKKNTVIVAVIALVTATMIFTMVSSYMISILDVQAKSRHALDLPLKTEECKHDTTEGPSCKNNENSGFEIKEFAPVVDHIDYDGDDRDSSNAPYDPNTCIPGNECPPRCPEGWTPATPPLNPQLGCLPDSITSDPGVQPEEDDGVLQSDDETTRGENEDLSSMLSATPSTVQDSSEQEDEEDEDDVDEEDVEEEDERNNEDGNVK